MSGEAREEQSTRGLAEDFVNLAVLPTTDTEIRVGAAAVNNTDAAKHYEANGASVSTDTDAARKVPALVDIDDDDEARISGGSGDDENIRVDAAELKENTNIYKSAFHIFKANVGTGVFMIPTFYKDAGYIVSVCLAIMIGCVVIDCTHHLLHTKLIINRRDVTTYSQICQYVCGTGLSWFLFIALCLTQFGFCLMYSQLFSAAMEELVQFEKSNYLWVSLMFILGFPMTCFSDNLSLLSVASILATVGVFYALISCFIESVMKLHENGVNPTCTPAGKSIPVGWFNNLANDMMVLEGIAIILPVHAACTQKRLVPRMITFVLMGVVTWYVLFGLTGYLAFGAKISKSLVSSMKMDAWGKSIRILFAINIVFTYPLQFMSAMQMIDQKIGCRPRSLKGIGVRLLINLIIWGLAMALGAEAVDIVVAFIGALPSTWMVIIIPGLVRLQVRYAVQNPSEDRNTLRYWKSIFTGHGEGSWTFLRVRVMIYMVLAVLIMVIGTYSIVDGQILNRDK